eukprot:CAMPEP_0119512316 /NCGR_PEP_ID=MMETSP1344-20130328/30728_1 /TAXON_ID=236787 /ORGANISM="Florenciella parvula, Strain CCMP2471" /LENGTH=119 /DNA_ID=CAMNT_0007549425 /DNA_START=195 /DNA_END=551 /DNA_ORIENTATION=-
MRRRPRHVRSRSSGGLCQQTPPGQQGAVTYSKGRSRSEHKEKAPGGHLAQDPGMLGGGPAAARAPWAVAGLSCSGAENAPLDHSEGRIRARTQAEPGRAGRNCAEAPRGTAGQSAPPPL